MHEVTQRLLTVSGWTWEGFPAHRTYNLTPEQRPRTIAEARRIAGDFASLDTAQLQTKTVSVKYGKLKRLK